MADSGAQSCFWSYKKFIASGFSDSDLIPVSKDLVAANKSPINLACVVILRLQGHNSNNSCATMLYISRDANEFYLSCEAMIDLKIVPPNFSCIGAADSSPMINSLHIQQSRALNAGCSQSSESPCSCPVRTAVPDCPSSLPLPCIPANNDKMKE